METNSGMVLPGDLDALRQRQERIIAPRQKRLDAGFAVQPVCECLGKGQRDVLLLRLGVNADRAGIDAAVPGVNGDDEITAAGLFGGRDRTGGLRGRRLVPGLRLDEFIKRRLVGHLGLEHQPLALAALVDLNLCQADANRPSSPSGRCGRCPRPSCRSECP
jgi:hypothetical protein